MSELRESEKESLKIYYVELNLVITGMRHYYINTAKKVEWDFLSSWLGSREEPAPQNGF